MKTKLLIALGAIMTLPACATITRGSNQQFEVRSEPPGARVHTSNGYQCESTPCTFRMPRKDPFRATIQLEGYVTQEIQVTSGVSGNGAAGMAGNVIFGGVVGGVVDATSGAMNDLSPNPLIVILEPVTGAQAEAADPQP